MLTPLEIRRQLFQAAKDDDAALALSMAKALHRMDAFIGERPKPTGVERFIQASEFPGRCNWCGKQIPVGAPIRWGKGVGQWHPEHWELHLKENTES